MRKALKWNSLFYGVVFFNCASPRPVPHGASKQKDARYIDILEDDEFDKARLAAWVKRAGELCNEAP